MVENKIQIKYIHVAYSARPFFVFYFMKNHSVLIINTAALIIQTTGKRQAITAERKRTKLLKMVKDRKQLSVPSFWGHNLVTCHHT